MKHLKTEPFLKVAEQKHQYIGGVNNIPVF